LKEALALKDRREWRRWLSENGNRANCAWLVIAKKDSDLGGINLHDAVDDAICFGWIDGKLKSNDEHSFFLRFSPRKKDSPWSEINRARAVRLIRSGKMREEGMAKVREAKQNGRWDAAYSAKAENPVPGDLRATLAAAGALRSFNSMTNSTRLGYIYWINQAKRADTRRRRIRETVKRASSSE